MKKTLLVSVVVLCMGLLAGIFYKLSQATLLPKGYRVIHQVDSNMRWR